MKYRVACADRVEPHEYIQAIGGPGWKMTAAQAITAINNGNMFVVSVAGQDVEIIVVTTNGKHYLRTKKDGKPVNNLVNLPRCP